MRKEDVTIIICCAGMGTRLGIGSTKALVDVCGKPLILRQLEMLDEYDDIRVVVGYQAEKVIEVVKKYRSDIMFAFNYQYETTGVAASFRKGLLGARKYVVSMDGDVLVNPSDFKAFMDYTDECICCNRLSSEEPVYISINSDHMVHSFNKNAGQMEWSGIAKIESKKLETDKLHVYEMLEAILPVYAFEIRARDIDTIEDYENMLRWFQSGCRD